MLAHALPRPLLLLLPNFLLDIFPTDHGNRAAPKHAVEKALGRAPVCAGLATLCAAPDIARAHDSERYALVGASALVAFDTLPILADESVQHRKTLVRSCGRLTGDHLPMSVVQRLETPRWPPSQRRREIATSRYGWAPSFALRMVAGHGAPQPRARLLRQLEPTSRGGAAGMDADCLEHDGLIVAAPRRETWLTYRCYKTIRR